MKNLTSRNLNFGVTTWSLGLLFLVACGSKPLPFGKQDNNDSQKGQIEKGLFAICNGGPSGAHFNLNIIGVPKGKTADMTAGSGRRIFVPLVGKSKILLSEGEFAVLDANATDGSGSFQLPNPDPENDGITTYSVFARALGKPGGSSTTTTCATDIATGELLCSTDSLVSVRTKGKSTFTDVSSSLLYLTADFDGDGDTERLNLFNDQLQDFFWDVDNNGLKLLQLRFYEVPSNVN
jgi:hypothetical protein